MPTLDLRTPARAVGLTLDVPPHLHAAAIATWHGRMVNEHGSAVIHEALAEQLERAGLPAADVALCHRFGAQERHHGVLCGAVVEALGGEARATIGEPERYPQHADASPIEAALRNVIHINCMSETVAVALVGAEREEMPEGPLHDLLTTIFSDECAHANFGWRLMRRALPDDAALKARLGQWLVVAFAHLEQHELSHLPMDVVPPPEGALVGLCSGPDARALFYATVEAVIIPGFEALGLPARDAWARRHEADAKGLCSQAASSAA
jgi:hypothetical protein